MIDVATEQWEMIRQIWVEHAFQGEVWAFGSRYRHEAHAHSDLDLVLVTPDKIPLAVLGDIRDAFEESDLPFRVDLLDWHRISASFQQIVQTGHEVIWPEKES